MQFIISLITFIKESQDLNIISFRDERRLVYGRYFSFVKAYTANYQYIFDALMAFKKVAPKLLNKIECDFYPNKHIKNRVKRCFGNNHGYKPSDIVDRLQRINHEKNPNTVAFLKRVLERAEKRNAEFIYFNNLSDKEFEFLGKFLKKDSELGIDPKAIEQNVPSIVYLSKTAKKPVPVGEFNWSDDSLIS